MNVTITTENGLQTATIEGRIDTTNAQAFEEAIQPLLSGDAPNIVLECGQFTYISSSGLRVFLLLQKSVLARGGKLVIRHLSADIHEVFNMTGFSAIFTIE